MESHLNVAVADRQLTFADSVAQRLLAQGVAVATAHTSLEELLVDLAGNPVDVVLLDWSLCPSLEDALRTLRERHPDVRVVVVGDRREPHRIVAAMQSGALGWAPKDISFEQLVSGLRTVSRGDRWVPDGLVAVLLEAMTRPGDAAPSERLLHPLTRREREVLQCMVDGLSRWETAVTLGMSPNTVRTHVQSVLHKLNVHSSLRAVALAREAGLSARPPQVPHQRPGS
jgi:DNA-binding NarL/FixJ family response regulator